VLHHSLTPFGPRYHRRLPLGLVWFGLPKTNCFFNAFPVHLLTYLSSRCAPHLQIKVRNGQPDARNVDPSRYI